MQLERPLAGDLLVSCRRCDAVLRRHAPGSLPRAVALNLAALVLFGIANFWPFLAFTFEGRGQVVSLASGVVRLWQEGMPLLAALVLGASILFPLVKMSAVLWALGPLLLERRVPGQPTALRLADALRAWSMLDVFLLAVIVAWVKLADLAALTPGPGLWAFVGTLLLSTAADATLDHHDFWQRLGPQATLARLATAVPQRLAACPLCGQIAPAGGLAGARCPRCGDRLAPPDPTMLGRSFALLIAAIALYLPANLLPVMSVTSLGRTEPSTILGGVVFLVEHGMIPIAGVVFVASVLVPVFKFLALGILLATTARASRWRPLERTRLWRLLEFVGRWSMVDVFVVALLVSLVDMGALATIEAGAGIAAFAATVVLTMLASASFDPRLIWKVPR